LFLVDCLEFLHVLLASLVMCDSLGAEPSLSVQKFNISYGLDGLDDSGFGFLGLEGLDFNLEFELLSLGFKFGQLFLRVDKAGLFCGDLGVKLSDLGDECVDLAFEFLLFSTLASCTSSAQCFSSDDACLQ